VLIWSSYLLVLDEKEKEAATRNFWTGSGINDGGDRLLVTPKPSPTTLGRRRDVVADQLTVSQCPSQSSRVNINLTSQILFSSDAQSTKPWLIYMDPVVNMDFCARQLQFAMNQDPITTRHAYLRLLQRA
jgi:hypothetical protein